MEEALLPVLLFTTELVDSNRLEWFLEGDLVLTSKTPIPQVISFTIAIINGRPIFVPDSFHQKKHLTLKPS